MSRQYNTSRWIVGDFGQGLMKIKTSRSNSVHNEGKNSSAIEEIPTKELFYSLVFRQKKRAYRIGNELMRSKISFYSCSCNSLVLFDIAPENRLVSQGSLCVALRYFGDLHYIVLRGVSQWQITGQTETEITDALEMALMLRRWCNYVHV